MLDIVRGSKIRRIQELGHDRLPTYGSCASMSRNDGERLGRVRDREKRKMSFVHPDFSSTPLFSSARKLVMIGALEEQNKMGAHGNVLTYVGLGIQATNVLQSRIPVKLSLACKQRRSEEGGKRQRSKDRTVSGADKDTQQLKGKLRELRNAIAAAEKVKPDTLFTDKQLQFIAQRRICTMEDFAEIEVGSVWRRGTRVREDGSVILGNSVFKCAASSPSKTIRVCRRTKQRAMARPLWTVSCCLWRTPRPAARTLFRRCAGRE